MEGWPINADVSTSKARASRFSVDRRGLPSALLQFPHHIDGHARGFRQTFLGEVVPGTQSCDPVADAGFVCQVHRHPRQKVVKSTLRPAHGVIFTTAGSASTR